MHQSIQQPTDICMYVYFIAGSGAGTPTTSTRLSAVILAFARGQLSSTHASISVESSPYIAFVEGHGGLVRVHAQSSGGQRPGAASDEEQAMAPFVRIRMGSDASTGGQGHVQIHAMQIIKGLPLHILSSLFVWQQGYHPLPALIRDIERMDMMTSGEYVCSAVKLLLALSPTCAAMNSSLVILDATFMRQMIDSMTMMLLTISSIAKRNFIQSVAQTSVTAKSREAAALLDAVADCIETVMGLVTEKASGDEDINVDAVIDALQLHPRGEIFVEAALEATRTLIQMLGKRLESGNGCSVFDPMIIAQNAECSLKFIERLFTDESLYRWYLKHDPNGSSILRLVCSAFELVTNESSMPPYLRMFDEKEGKHFYNAVRRRKPEFYPTDPAGGVAEHIVSRVCGLLLSICEHSPWFYDVACAADQEGKLLAKVMLESFTDTLVQILMRPLLDSHPPSHGEAQLTINCLRVAEMLTDDSNFKDDVRKILKANLANTFACMEPKNFKSFWGPGAQAIGLMGHDDVEIHSSSTAYRAQDEEYWRAARAWQKVEPPPESNGVLQKMSKRARERGLRFALERTILLAKMLGNLQMQSEEGGEDFVATMAQFAKSSSPAECSGNNFARNVKYLFSVASQFGVQNSANYPGFMTEIDLELAEQVLNALKRK